MKDETKIKPALTEDEWKRASIEPGARASLAFPSRDTPRDRSERSIKVPAEHAAPIVAIANASLADSDPRKITRGKVDALTYLVRTHQRGLMEKYGPENTWNDEARGHAGFVAQLDRLAEALGCYLPPRS